MNPNPNKPLGGPAYGSIPHLPGSRLGPGDHHCHEGQARIITLRARDRHDLIHVQEKLDGSNVAIALIGGEIVSLTRKGWRAETSAFEMHHLFARWVKRNEVRFRAVLEEGERICGEWLAQAHGTRYALTHEPFVAFDIISNGTRLVCGAFMERVSRSGFITPRLIHTGGPMSIEAVLSVLEPSGHGALDPVEGAVWRLERHGQVELLAKFVRPDKKDGIYLPEKSGSGGEAVWNWREPGGESG